MSISIFKMKKNVQHYSQNIANDQQCVGCTDMPLEVGGSEDLKIAPYRKICTEIRQAWSDNCALHQKATFVPDAGVSYRHLAGRVPALLNEVLST